MTSATDTPRSASDFEQFMVALRAEMGVPKRYANDTFSGYVAKTPSQVAALESARALAATEDALEGLVLMGPPGVGKSHLLAAACNAIYGAAIDDFRVRDAKYRDEKTAWAAARPDGTWNDRMDYEATAPRQPLRPAMPWWCNIPSLIIDLRTEMGSDDKPMTDWARRLRDHRGLVVLDDLGREKMSEWTGELVYAIVNARYEAYLSTAVASNLSPEELRDSGYWPAISRLAEHGRQVVIQGPDARFGKEVRTDV